MSQLLLELFSEEIPARLQGKAAEDLLRLVTAGLHARGLKTEAAQAFATPRRLALMIKGVPAQSPGSPGYNAISSEPAPTAYDCRLVPPTCS